jgi:V/A-type H+-transporting ATPase subunit I
MSISIFIGATHVILATFMDAYRQRGSPAGLAPLGWSILVTGGLLLGSQMVIETLPAWPGQAAMVVGLMLVLVFSGYGASAVQRTVQGLLALTRLTKAFGDVLSYLRLFALGLASASLAVAFNDMAAGIREAVPGIGLFLGLLVFGLGHALNFILAVASGVIHGLRLNVIEFFDWGVTEEGNLFRAFRRKGSE